VKIKEYQSYKAYAAEKIPQELSDILLSKEVWVALIGVAIAIWKVVSPETLPLDVFAALEGLIITVIAVLSKK
jgi:hypothetical protein